MLRHFVIIAAALCFAQPVLEAQNIFRPSQGGQMSAAPGVSSPINQGMDGGPI